MYCMCLRVVTSTSEVVGTVVGVATGGAVVVVPPLPPRLRAEGSIDSVGVGVVAVGVAVAVAVGVGVAGVGVSAAGVVVGVSVVGVGVGEVPAEIGGTVTSAVTLIGCSGIRTSPSFSILQLVTETVLV